MSEALDALKNVTNTGAPVAPAPVKQTSSVSKGGAAPKEPSPSTVTNGVTTVTVPAPKDADKSPRFKMLDNCGIFLKDQIVSADEIMAAYPGADDWVKRGIAQPLTIEV